MCAFAETPRTVVVINVIVESAAAAAPAAAAAAAMAALCVYHSWSGRHYQIMRSKLPLSYVRMYEKRM